MRFILCFLVLSIACAPPKKEEQKQITSKVDYQVPNFKIYPHRDSLNIQGYISSAENGQAILSNPTLFLYQDNDRKIRIAVEKNSSWHTWEIFDASDYTYDAAIRLEDFDKKGQKELIITSFYGMRPQSTMGSTYYGDTDIWDLDNVQLYFSVAHLSYSDDMGRNGDNTYSEKCQLQIQIQPQLITVLKDKETATLEANAACYQKEEYPKYYRLIDKEVVLSTDSVAILESL